MEMLHVRIPTETHKDLKVYAASNGISITFLVGEIIGKFLRDKKELAN